MQKQAQLIILLNLGIIVASLICGQLVKNRKEGLVLGPRSGTEGVILTYLVADDSEEQITLSSSPTFLNQIDLSTWDLSNINATDTTFVNPPISTDITNTVYLTYLINYIQSKTGKKTQYTSSAKTNYSVSGNFPGHGSGVCMSDSPVNRTIYWDPTLPNYRADFPQNPVSRTECIRILWWENCNTQPALSRPSYENCAKSAKDYGATVFGLNYRGDCYIGNTPQAALGIVPSTNGSPFTATSLTDSNSWNCGKPFGLGHTNTQNVYAKNARSTTTPSKTYNYFPTEDLKTLFNALKTEGYSNLNWAMAAYIKDENLNSSS